MYMYSIEKTDLAALSHVLLIEYMYSNTDLAALAEALDIRLSFTELYIISRF